MGLITVQSKKNSYTRKEDEQIVKMKNEGKTAKEISAALGTHSEASVTYRVTRVLAKHDNFNTIKYKKAAAAPAVAAKAPAGKKD